MDNDTVMTIPSVTVGASSQSALPEHLHWLIQHKGPIIFGFVAVFLLAGYLLPFAKPIGHLGRFGSLGRIVKNFSLAGLNALLSLLVVVPVSVFAARWSLDWRPDWMGGWAGLVFDLILMDLWIYGWHRANHVFHLLWRFHEVHHLDESLDASTALRFHFGEVFNSSLVRAAVIFLLAVPFSSVLAFETLVAMIAIFHHSNVRLPAALERALSWAIVTPSIHWVHHHATRADTDSNYATILSVWDRLFGSVSTTLRTADLRMGVEGQRDTGLAALVLRPFRRAATDFNHAQDPR